MKPFEYYCLTDWEFGFIVEGYKKRSEIELWGVRQISYPIWFANARKEDIVDIEDYIPIPGLDKKRKSIVEKKWTPQQIKEVFGEYYGSSGT